MLCDGEECGKPAVVFVMFNAFLPIGVEYEPCPRRFCKKHFELLFDSQMGDSVITYEEYLHAIVNREISGLE
jgi:hypothetical protein